MFQVKSVESGRVINVYSVKTSEAEVLMFLTFDFGKWFWVPAADYAPVDYPY